MKARVASGARIVGHKIGLTSRVMRMTSKIDEPDYGHLLDDMHYENGATIPVSGFGMEIAYHNRRQVANNDAVYFADPRQLVAASDVLLLAWPSAPETRWFISANTLDLAKPNLILINIGRGDLVEDADLIAALRDRRILAAGLDVFDGEPNINSGYRELPNAFLLPHIGSSTIEARMAIARTLLDALNEHLCGRSPDSRIA